MSYGENKSPNEDMMGVETGYAINAMGNKGPRRGDEADFERPSVISELSKISEMVEIQAKFLSELVNHLDPILEPESDNDAASFPGDEMPRRALIFDELDSIKRRIGRLNNRVLDTNRRVQL